MESEKTRVALLVDHCSLSKWQENALSTIADLVEIVLVLNCTNTVTKKHVARHGAYYALNLVSIRSPLTRKRNIAFAGCPVIDFESRYEKAWQWIPEDAVARLAQSGCRFMLKFGMSLLKTDNFAGIDVLSFHHGDPRHYRGRPAGFYELLHDAPSVGFIVQKLSNELDGGEVLALGHAKAYQYSYRQTLQGLYLSSPALLRCAVINLLADRKVGIQPEGKNYRLPGNGLVAQFCVRLLAHKARRLLYGAFWEKRWNISVFENIDPTVTLELPVSDAKRAQIPDRYNFYADPFFSTDGRRIRAEALVGATGRGEIIELDSESLQVERTLLTGPHFSFPYPFADDGREFVLPEVASHEAPYLLEISGTPQKIPLRGLEHTRVVDPALVKVDGRYYLFGGHSDSARGMLQLYVADSIDGPYKPHRMNSVVIDPSCARMGGRLLMRGGKLYRFGQDNSGAYGGGIRVMEVVTIDPEVYEEKEVGHLCFSDASGPHTIDTRNGRTVLDFYVDKFSILAGYRRLVAMVYGRLRGTAG